MRSDARKRLPRHRRNVEVDSPSLADQRYQFWASWGGLHEAWL